MSKGFQGWRAGDDKDDVGVAFARRFMADGTVFECNDVIQCSCMRIGKAMRIFEALTRITCAGAVPQHQRKP